MSQQSDEEYARQQASAIGAMVRDEDIDIYEIEADAKRRLLAAIQYGREYGMAEERTAQYSTRELRKRDDSSGWCENGHKKGQRGCMLCEHLV